MGNKKSTIFSPRLSTNSDSDLNPASSCSIFRRRNPEKFLDYNGASFDEYYSSTEGVSNEFVWSNKSIPYKQTLGKPEDFKQFIGSPKNLRHLSLADPKTAADIEKRTSQNLENVYGMVPVDRLPGMEGADTMHGMVAVDMPDHVHGMTVLDKLPTDWTQGPYVRKENVLRQTDNYGLILQSSSDSTSTKNVEGGQKYNRDSRHTSQEPRVPNQDARISSQDSRALNRDARSPKQDAKYTSQDDKAPYRNVRYTSHEVRSPNRYARAPSQDTIYSSQDVRAPSQPAKYISQDGRAVKQGSKYTKGAKYTRQDIKYARSVPVVASFPDLLTVSTYKQHIVETYENTTSSQPDLSDTSTIPYQVPVSYKTKTVPYNRRDSREGSLVSGKREIYGIPIQKSPALREVNPGRYPQVEDDHPDSSAKQNFKHKASVHINHNEKKPPDYANVKIKKKAERNVMNVKINDTNASSPSRNVETVYLSANVNVSDTGVESDVNGVLSEADTDDRRYSLDSYDYVLETSVDISDSYGTSTKLNPAYIRYISNSDVNIRDHGKNIRDSPSSVCDSSFSFPESSVSIRDSTKDVCESSSNPREFSSSICPNSLSNVERMTSLVNHVKLRKERSRSQITEDDIKEMSELEDDRNNSSSCNSSKAHCLGSAQTKAVCGSWKMIYKDLQKNGLQSVVNLFEVHPIIKNHFEGIIRKSPIHMRLNDILNDHAYFVMNIVGIVIEYIDSLDLLGELMDQLGKLHIGHGVNANDIDIMGPVFCSAIRPILLKNEVWDVSIEDAWMELFKIIVIMMKKPFEDEKLPFELNLTPPQKCVIVGTWTSIFERQLVAGVGTKTIVDLFSAEPNIIKYFAAFRETNIPDMFLNKAVQNHGIRVMNLIRMIVENIDNTAKIRDHMVILGRQHVKRGVKENYLDLMGPVFCQAIRPMLMDERQWSMEIESAWSHLFKILSSLMKIAYKDAQLVETFPSQSDREMIRSTWASILPKLDAIGVELFYYFFNQHADLCHYFPQVRKQSTADVRMSKFVKDHSRRFMNMIKMFVDNLENLASIKPKLREIGEKHHKLGVRSEHLDLMGRVFCHSVRPLLVSKNNWSLEKEDAWLAAFRNMCENIKKGYPKDKRKTSKMRRTQ